MKHTVDYVMQHGRVMVKGGNPCNPNTFWRMPSDMTSWFLVADLAREQGWRSTELDGDLSRVGATAGP